MKTALLRRASIAPCLLVALGSVALAAVFFGRPTARVPHDDEFQFAAAAANLSRFGVLSIALPAEHRPPADAYREPLYPALIALSWRLTGVPPWQPGETAREFLQRADVVRATRLLNGLLVGCAALAAAAMARRLARPATTLPEQATATAQELTRRARLGSALAFALVASSPMLGASAQRYAPENLAAAALTLATLALLQQRNAPRWPIAATACSLLPLVRVEYLAAIPAAALVCGSAPAGRWPKLRRGAAFVLLASLPSAALAISDPRRPDRRGPTRQGVVLMIRSELNAEVARHGALNAALAFTPLHAAQRVSERRAPAARFNQPAWSGDRGNFASRALRAWQAALASPDPEAANRSLERTARRNLFDRPLSHAVTTLVVAWRGLFAEASPIALSPIDLRFACGLLFAAAAFAAATRAFAFADRRALELRAALAPTAAVFAALAFATEFLPRFSLPFLPIGRLLVAELTLAIAARARARVRG